MLEKPRTVLATKPLVKEFFEMDRVPRERPLSERRMMVYERILKEGNFRTVVWASALCKETNCTYRVNGQHTSTLLSKLETLPDFHVTLERYVCDTLVDVANLYNTFDSAVASRTTSDINCSFASTVSELRTIHLRIINLAVNAITEETWSENEMRRISPAEKAEQLLDNIDFVQWLDSFMLHYHSHSYKDSKTHGSTVAFRRAAVVRAMLATFRKNRVDAEKFWLLVRDETDTDRNAPARVLSRYLNRITVQAGNNAGGNSGKRIASKREIFVKCIHGWNAWRKGEATQLMYYASAPLPALK